MDEKITKFYEELSNCNDNKYLILGNGFGLSYDSVTEGNSFKWNTLFDLCNFKDNNSTYRLLKQCNFDFELAQQKLNNAIDVIKNYDSDNKLISKFEMQISELRDQLIYTVTESHPVSFNSQSFDLVLARKMVVRCRSFFEKFKTVFSLNYDLLLYWVRCYENPYLGFDYFSSENDELVFVSDSRYPDSKVKFFSLMVHYLYIEMVLQQTN